MKKIGTLTFHWATNYGAVLQAWALQQYLLQCGYDTEIIRYLPRRIRLIQRIQALQKFNFSWFKREKNIQKFRKRELLQGRKRYMHNRALFHIDNLYDAILCGSDQIWNSSFTLSAEGKPTLSYFENFAPPNVRRIAYAVSFGADRLPENMQKLIQPELEKFYAISVREKTGQQLLSEMGIKSQLVADPTLLLEREVYDRLLQKAKFSKNKASESRLFAYILHHGQSEVSRTAAFCRELLQESDKACCTLPDGDVYDWLIGIRDASFVVTNSFHGTVFSILFHKPFLTMPVEGANMNDRLHTLLSSLCLTSRWLPAFNTDQIYSLCAASIDWDDVENRLTSLRENARQFIHTALEGE